MPKRKRPVLGVDYTIEPDGKAEFTPEYLLKRGYCCEHECRYCPFLAGVGSGVPMAAATASGSDSPATTAGAYAQICGKLL